MAGSEQWRRVGMYNAGVLMKSAGASMRTPAPARHCRNVSGGQVALQGFQRTLALCSVRHCRQVNPDACAGINQCPRIALIIDFRGASTARACTGRAVVLSCQRNAVALFFGLCLCGRGMGGKRRGHCACDGKGSHRIRHRGTPKRRASVRCPRQHIVVACINRQTPFTVRCFTTM